MKNSVPRETTSLKRTYTILLFIEHEGSDGPPGIGTSAGLTTNMDGGVASTILVLSTRNGVSGHWHSEISGGRKEVEITEVVDGGTTSQWCSLYPFPVRTIAKPEHTDHLVSSGSSSTSITKPHHFSVRSANSIMSAPHTLSS